MQRRHWRVKGRHCNFLRKPAGVPRSKPAPIHIACCPYPHPHTHTHTPTPVSTRPRAPGSASGPCACLPASPSSRAGPAAPSTLPPPMVSRVLRAGAAPSEVQGGGHHSSHARTHTGRTLQAPTACTCLSTDAARTSSSFCSAASRCVGIMSISASTISSGFR